MRLRFLKGQSSQGEEKGEVTFGVVQDSLEKNWILGESLGHQQNALLNSMAAQQRPAASTLIFHETQRAEVTDRQIQRSDQGHKGGNLVGGELDQKPEDQKVFSLSPEVFWSCLKASQFKTSEGRGSSLVGSSSGLGSGSPGSRQACYSFSRLADSNSGPS